MLGPDKVIARKRDIVQAQLFSAIHIFFHRDDPISIHTLTEAAYQILEDIGKAADPKFTMIKDDILNKVKPERRGEFLDIINHARNFFKHADEDLEAKQKKLNRRKLPLQSYHVDETKLDAKCTLVFLHSHMILYSACLAYCKLIGVEIIKIPAMYIFFSWCLLQYPEIFVQDQAILEKVKDQAKEVKDMNKSEFFKYSYLALKDSFDKGTIHDI